MRSVSRMIFQHPQRSSRGAEIVKYQMILLENYGMLTVTVTSLVVSTLPRSVIFAV
jgi:hypothetical protein